MTVGSRVVIVVTLAMLVGACDRIFVYQWRAASQGGDAGGGGDAGSEGPIRPPKLDARAPTRHLAPSARPQRRPAVAARPGQYLVVWQQEQPDLRWRIYGSLVDYSEATATPAAAQAISGVTGWHRKAAVAAGPGSFLTVWEKSEGARLVIEGATMDFNTGRTAAPVELVKESGRQATPALAFGADGYLLVWHQSDGNTRSVRAIKLDAYGRAIGSSTLVAPISTPWSWPAVVGAAGGAFYVAWQDFRRGSLGVIGRWFGKGGAPLDVSRTIADQDKDQGVPALAFDGRYVTVYWQDADTGHILARRVLEGGGIEPKTLVVSPDSGKQQLVAAAYASFSTLVVWQNQPDATRSNDLYGAFVVDGTLASGHSYSYAGGTAEQTWPALAVQSKIALVAWQDDDKIFGMTVVTP